MDLSTAAQPRSDQLNADDLIGGPELVTITEVRKGNDEQPVEIVTREFGPKRPYKPGKSMIRVLIAAWGKEASAYTGRRLMLYRDPSITFGKDAVGGIRISAMSDIQQRLTIALTVTRGRRAPFTVEPLKDTPPVAAPSGNPTLRRLNELYEKAGLPKDRRDDRILIAGHLVQRPDLTNANQLSDDEIDHVVSELDGWNRDGTLTDKVGDILDQATIDAEGKRK